MFSWISGIREGRNEFVAYLCDELKDLIEGPAAEAATAAAGRSAGNPNARRTAM